MTETCPTCGAACTGPLKRFMTPDELFRRMDEAANEMRRIREDLEAAIRAIPIKEPPRD